MNLKDRLESFNNMDVECRFCIIVEHFKVTVYSVAQLVFKAILHHVGKHAQLVWIIAQTELARLIHCLNNIVQCDE